MKKRLATGFKPVYIEVSLPCDKNFGMDCGALAVQMLMLTDIPSKKNEARLKNVRKKVNKTPIESTLPGNICKALKELGYEVSYFSTIDWESLIHKSQFKWDPRVLRILENDKQTKEFSNSINVEKLKSSANWLNSANVISKGNLTIENVVELLGQGKRIIPIVDNGSHYVVIVGVDNKYVYYNNPISEAVRAVKTHKEFMSYWGKALGMTEAIVASR